MKISAEALQMIEVAKQIGYDKQHFQSPAITRQQLKEASVNPNPTPVGEVINRVIGSSDIPVRIYLPEGEGPFAVIAYFHGGGFVVGGLDTHDEICRKLCKQSGCVVMSVDYKLAPEHPYPQGQESSIEATLWTIENAGQFKATGDRIAFAGDSSGGYMAIWVSTELTRRGIPVKALFAAYPPTDHYTAHHPSWDEFRSGYVLSAEMMQWFWDQYVWDPKDADAASPLRNKDFSGLPPTFIVNGNFDPLRDEGIAYAEKLKAAGVEVRHEIVNNVHGFFGIGETGEKVLSEAAQFLKERLQA